MNPEVVKAFNVKREGVRRKSGLVIRSGDAMTAEEREDLKRWNRAKFELQEEEWQAIDIEAELESGVCSAPFSVWGRYSALTGRLFFLWARRFGCGGILADLRCGFTVGRVSICGGGPGVAGGGRKGGGWNSANRTRRTGEADSWIPLVLAKLIADEELHGEFGAVDGEVVWPPAEGEGGGDLEDEEEGMDEEDFSSEARKAALDAREAQAAKEAAEIERDLMVAQARLDWLRNIQQSRATA